MAGRWTPPSLGSEWFMNLVSELVLERRVECLRLPSKYAALVITITYEEQTAWVCLLLCIHPCFLHPIIPQPLSFYFLMLVLMPGLFTSFLDEHYQNTNCFNTKFQNTSKETQFLLPVSSLRGEIPVRNKGLHSSCKDRMKHCWTQHHKKPAHISKSSTQTHNHTDAAATD